MFVQVIEHKTLLIMLAKIEDAIAKLKDPFNKDVIAYKHYFDLLSKTIVLLTTTIKVNESKDFNDVEYKELSLQLEVLQKLCSSTN